MEGGDAMSYLLGDPLGIVFLVAWTVIGAVLAKRLMKL
jgi:hypothetical protein